MVRQASPTAAGAPGLHAGEHRATASEEKASAPEEAPLILVVEDNAEVRTYLRRHLAPHYRIDEAAHGREALAQIANERPDLVLSDVMMPEMDGLALCRAIKEDKRLRDMPVLLLTARAGTEEAVEGLACGADDYVEKPFDMPRLQARIHRLITTRHDLHQQYSREVVMQPTGLTISSEEEAFFEQARAVVEAHIGDEQFTVEVFADAMGMSKSTLARRLKQATGLTPAAFVQHLRLERAGQLLAQGPRSVAEVADAVGYRDPEHFSKLFRKHHGVLPSRYATDTS